MAPGGGALPESSWRQGAGVSLRGREQQYAHVDFHFRGPPRQEYDQWRPRGWPGSGFEQQDWQAPGSGYRARAPPTFQGGRDFNFRDPMHNRDFHNRDFRDVNRDFNRDIREQPAFHRDFREFNRSGWRDDRGLDMPRAPMEQSLPTRWSGGRAPAPPAQPMMFGADEQSAMERMLPSFLHSKASPTNDSMPEEWPDEPSAMAPTSVASQSSMWRPPAGVNSGFPATANVGSVSVGAGLSALNPIAAALQTRAEPPWPSAGETMASNAVSSHLAALTGCAADQYTLNEAEALVAASVLKPLDPFSSSGGSPPPVAAFAAPMHTGSEQLAGRQSTSVLINQLFPIAGASTEPTQSQTTVEIADRAVPPAETVSTRAPEPLPQRSDAPVEPQQRQTAAANAQGVPVAVVASKESLAAQPQASATQSPSVVASPEDTVKAREQWHYIDHSGALQGPYRQAVMSAWFRGKYFFPTLRVRRAIDSEFVQLGALALLLHSCAHLLIVF